MARLRIDEILRKEDLPCFDVTVEQWGGAVGVRTLRADERSEIERQFSKKKPGDDPAGFRRALLRACLVNDDGTALLPDDEHAKQFMGKCAEAVEVLFEKACEINGFRQKDVETLEKNSPTPQPC